MNRTIRGFWGNASARGLGGNALRQFFFIEQKVAQLDLAHHLDHVIAINCNSEPNAKRLLFRVDHNEIDYCSNILTSTQ